MTDSDTVRGEVTPEAARQTWKALEPYHAMIYFAPEAAAAYDALGLDTKAGYFASRAAALGPVSAEVVTATFYNFNPAAVRWAVPAVWETAAPDRILAARLTAVDATLRRVLGGAADSDDMARAAELARRAAEAASDVSGRPLFAAHAALPWPEEPHMVLWHAQTLLREYRGDGHLAALITAGLSGIESLVVHAATGEIPAKALRATRAWPEPDWSAAVDRLRARGWLTDGPDPALTSEGGRWRHQIEETTDRLALAPYAALGADGCAELRGLSTPLTKPLVDELAPWAAARYRD